VRYIRSKNSFLTDYDFKKSPHGVLIQAQRGGGEISQLNGKLALERGEWASRPVWMAGKYHSNGDSNTGPCSP
jgi:hypothetical protein